MSRVCMVWSLAVLLSCLPESLVAQRRVDVRYQGERLLAIVPMTGAGTPADPRRPMFAPMQPSGNPRQPGIEGFRYVVSDDGRFALVEFVARDASAFASILGANTPDVKAFERKKAAPAAVQQEFRRLKRDFDLARFLGGGQ
jgi:hypothetical protein